MQYKEGYQLLSVEKKICWWSHCTKYLFVEKLKSQFNQPMATINVEILELRTLLKVMWLLKACQGYLSTFLFGYAKLNVGQYYYLGLNCWEDHLLCFLEIRQHRKLQLNQISNWVVREVDGFQSIVSHERSRPKLWRTFWKGIIYVSFNIWGGISFLKNFKYFLILKVTFTW